MEPVYETGEVSLKYIIFAVLFNFVMAFVSNMWMGFSEDALMVSEFVFSSLVSFLLTHHTLDLQGLGYG